MSKSVTEKAVVKKMKELGIEGWTSECEPAQHLRNLKTIQKHQSGRNKKKNNKS